MAAPYWWIEDADGNTIYDIGNVQQLKRGGTKKDYSTTALLTKNGKYIKGIGLCSEKTYEIEVNLKALDGHDVYLNVNRDILISKLLKDKIYFYEKTGEGLERFCRVYCTQLGDETIDYQRGLIKKSFTLFSPDGVLKSTTTTTYNLTLTDSTNTNLVVTNSGNIPCPFRVIFEPTADEAYFKIENNYNSNGFKFQKTYFQAGIVVEYNTDNNSLLIDDVAVNVSNYKVAGKPILLNPGTNNLYIQFSGNGSADFTIEFEALYV
jgi:hypothetical protein